MRVVSARRGNFVALVVAASALCGAVRAYRDDDDDGGGGSKDAKWIRLCTLTSRGGSVINVTAPCGVRVSDESAVEEERAPGDLRDGGGTPDGRLHSNVTAGLGVTARPTDGGEVDGRGEEYDDNDDDVTAVEAQDDGVTVVDAPPDDGGDGNVDVRTSGDGSDDATVDETVEADDRHDGGAPSEVSGAEVTTDVAAHGDVGDRAGENDNDDDTLTMTVVRDEPDGHQEGHWRHGAVTKAFLGYLLEARNRLHDKIRKYVHIPPSGRGVRLRASE